MTPEDPAPLTTTSYAVLSLLALRPWTTYELAKQMRRSVHWFWPRAERKLYEEPKKLVRHGLAAAERRQTGLRRSTVYRITDAGRGALATWVRQPSCPPPELQFEALLRVFAADHGGADDLRRVLETVRDQMEEWQRFGTALSLDIATSGGPFPSRTHINALVHRFLSHYVEAMRGWAIWALEETANWETTAPDEDKLARGREVMLLPMARVGGQATTKSPTRTRA